MVPRARPSKRRPAQARQRPFSLPMLAALGIGGLILCSMLAALIVPAFDGNATSPEMRDPTPPVVDGSSEYETALRARLQSDPQDIGAWIALGNLLSTRGQYSDAASAYTQALVLNPDQVEAHRAFGMAMIDARQLAIAEEQLRWLVDHDPTDVDAWYFLGETYRLWLPQRTDDAAAAYQQAIDVAPGTVSAEQAAMAMAALADQATPAATPEP